MRFTGEARGLSALFAALLAGHAAFAQETVQTATLAPAPLAAPPAPPVLPPLSPEALALRAAMEAASAGWDPAERADVLGFYAARGFAPYWADQGRGVALVALLEEAPAHGLPPARYGAAGLADGLTGSLAAPDRIAALELAGSRSWIAFAGDLKAGVLVPSRVDPEIDVRPARPGRAALLALLDGGEAAAIARSLEPKTRDYRALMAEKARLEGQSAADWGPTVPAGPTMRQGDAGPRVAALRARLAARGHPAAASEARVPAGIEGGVAAGVGAGVFDAGLDAALKGFQAEAGLEPDGLAGAQTVAALNEGPEGRLRQVAANLERMRWNNSDLGPRYIVANIPDYQVRMVENGRVVFESRVVVGRADTTRTPEFQQDMTYFVVNPTWHIPDSIAQRVYLPKLKKNPNTLANSNMRIFTRSGTEIDPGLVDFTQFSQGNFPFRIKQNPSDANALGRVKFMFPNHFSIYLHDTPHRELFAKTERDFSNGCVRVEKPLDLAYVLLEGQVADPRAAFDGWLAAKTEKTVMLKQPVPVRIEYRTVFLDDAGRVQHRFDIYGRDAEVARALEAKGVTLAGAQG